MGQKHGWFQTRDFASYWFKHFKGKTQGLSICKQSDKDLMRTMESAVRFGKPVLIENVGVELDPALDPILMRQTYNQGGLNLFHNTSKLS